VKGFERDVCQSVIGLRVVGRGLNSAEHDFSYHWNKASPASYSALVTLFVDGTLL